MALSNALQYWDTPESIPLLSSLISKLLVSCASMVFDSSTPTSKSSQNIPSKAVRQANNVLKKPFRLGRMLENLPLEMIPPGSSTLKPGPISRD